MAEHRGENPLAVVVQFDAVKECTDAFTLLFKRRNWLLGAPYVASLFLLVIVVGGAMLVAFGPEIFRGITSPGGDEPSVSPMRVVLFAVALTIGIILGIAVNVFTYAWTLVAAEPVWRGQDPAWDRGFNRAAEKLLTLLAYTVLIALLAIVSVITIVGPIVVAFFALYGPAYIVFGDKSATAAIGASFKLASENIAPTLILVLSYIVIYFTGLFTVFVFNIVGIVIPFIGLIPNLAFQWLWSAYIAVSIVRFYEILNATSGEPPFPIVPKTSV